jgi:hypothetical protein
MPVLGNGDWHIFFEIKYLSTGPTVWNLLGWGVLILE